MSKKNIFDTEIEMIDLDSVGNLDFIYEEMGSPNPELGDDLKMVMKETQVFSSDDIEKALEKNAVEEMELDLGSTRVIDPIEEIEGFLSEDEVEETVNEEVFETSEIEETVEEDLDEEEPEAEDSDTTEYEEETSDDEEEVSDEEEEIPDNEEEVSKEVNG